MAIAVVGLQVKVGGVKTATAELASLKTSIDKLVTSVRGLSRIKVPKLANQLNIVQGGQAVIDQRDYSKVVDQSTKTVIRFGNMSERAAKSVNILTRATKGLGTALNFTVAGISRFINKIKNTGRSLISFGSIISTLGFRLSVLFAPFVLGLGSAITKAVSFEDSIVGLVTRVRISAAEMEIMRDGVLGLSQALGVAPTELAAAAYGVMSREVRDTTDALKILEVSAKASAVGLGEVDAIAKFVSAAFIVMGEEAGGVTGIIDTLVRAVQFGAIEAEDFTESLGRALGIAVNLGINLDELTAFVGVYGIATDDASEAVTGLVGVMRAIIKPTKQAKEAFARIFGTGSDLEAGAKAAQEALAEIGLFRFINSVSQGAAELDIPLANIFTRLRGLNAALFVSQAAFEEYQRVLAATKDSAGALDEAFKIVQATTGFQLKLLKSNIEIAAITLGDALLPAINTIVQAIVPMIIALKDLIKLHPQLGLIAAAFVLVGAVVGPLVIIFGIFLSTIGTILSAGAGLVALLFSLLNPLNLVAAAVAVLAGLFIAAFAVQIPGQVRQGISDVQDDLIRMSEDTGETMTSFADAAFVWGKNIILELARGMADGAIFVLNVIRDIGNAITTLLRGASPPPLLPDLNIWGKNIIDELLHGFTLADFSVFDDLTGIMSRFFSSLPESVLSREAGAEALLGSREGIARAIEEYKELGFVTQNTLDRITGSFGHVSEDIQEYIRLMLAAAEATAAVAAIQEEITAITNRFDDSVRPLNKRLKEIAGRFDEVKRSQEREALQDILDDPRAPELAKELALLQLEKLSIEEQVGEAEDLRDTELEAANERLRAAQAIEQLAYDQLKLQRSIVDALIGNVSVMKDMESAADAVKKATEGIGAALGELNTEFGDGGGILGALGAALTEQADTIKEHLTGIFDELAVIFKPVEDAWNDVRKAWKEVFKTMNELDISTLDVLKTLAGIWFGLKIIKAIGVANLLKGLWKGLQAVWFFGKLARAAMVGSVVGQGFVGALGKIAPIMLGPAGVLAVLATFLALKIAEKYDTNAEAVEAFVGALESMHTYWTERGLKDHREWVEWLNAVRTEATGLGTDLVTLGTKIGEWAKQAGIDINTWSIDAIADIDNFFANFDTNIIEFLNGSAGDLTAFFNNLAENISTAVTTALDNVAGAWDRLTAAVGRFIEKLKGVGVPDDLHESESNYSRTLRHTKEGYEAATAAALAFLNVNRQMSIPVPLAQQAALASGGSNQFQIGPNTISNGMDDAIFEARVRQIVAGAIS